MPKLLVIRHHTSNVGLGLLEEVSNELGIEFEERFINEGAELPKDTSGYAGIILMGGKQSVYDADKYPWMQKELVWLEDKLKNPKKPILGVCLGCQLIAQVLGGRVFKGTKGIEVGFKKIGFKKQDDIHLKPSLCGQHVFQWHQDTFEMPEGAELIAAGLTYTNQAIRFKENVYGFQFHPDVCEKRIENWYGEDQGKQWAEYLPPLDDVLLKYKSHKPVMRSFLRDFLKSYFL